MCCRDAWNRWRVYIYPNEDDASLIVYTFKPLKKLQALHYVHIKDHEDALTEQLAASQDIEQPVTISDQIAPEPQLRLA